MAILLFLYRISFLHQTIFYLFLHWGVRKLSNETGLKPIFLLVFYIFSFFYMELLLKISIGGSLLSLGTLLTLIFSSMTAIITYILSRLFQPTVNHILSIVFLSLAAIIYYSQFIYYKFFKTFYTIYSAGNATQVAEYWQDIIEIILKNAFFLFAFFLPIIIIAAFGRKLYRYSKIKRLTFLSHLSILSLLYLTAILIIHTSGKDINSPYDLYYLSNSPPVSVNKLGLLTTMRLDLQRQITHWSPTYNKPVTIIQEPESDPPPKDPPNQNQIPSSDDQKEPVFIDQIMEIDFDSLMAKEKNPIVNDMHLYFKNIKPTKTNEYTGKYKGYNLIFLTAEGFSSYAVQQDVTPTLYKMVHEGYQFSNFYNPIWGVSTSDGEYVATQGLIPKSGVWSFYESGKNHLPFVMGNQLKSLGYKTVAYHNHTFDYYNRDVSHPNLGYEYKALGNGLNIKETWPESDLEMMEVTIPEYISQEPFHAYYMTVSGHMLYNFTGNYIAYKNKELVDHLPYSEEAKAYLATQIELDKALELLLNKLEEAGIADRTLIALSADHYPYGLDKKTIDELAGHKVEENFELYKSTLILYTKGMEPVKIQKPASSLDIIPTLSNLFGLEYDSRLLMGRDLFSDSDGLVIFSNRSFITNKGKYNALENKFYPYEGAKVENDYVKRMQAIVNNKFYYSSMILDQDYYAKVLQSNH